MHEYALAAELVQRVIEEAESHHAAHVLRVIVQIGELTMIEDEQLQFNYGIIIEDTLLAGSKLEIHRITPRVKCPQCGYEGGIKTMDDAIYHMMVPSLSCPSCGERVKVIEGREFIIQSIDLEVK